MNAVSLYISTCRYVIQSNPQDPETWVDLYRYLPYLRQALSCCVCTQVFHCPMGPEDTKCQHHVCKDCIGGKMRLKPACGWCNNYDLFVEKPQLRIIVQCFKKLCEYLASTAIAVNLASTNNGGTSTGNQLLTIIQDGIAIKGDNYPVPDSTLNLLPPPKLQKVEDATSTETVDTPIKSSTVKKCKKGKRKRTKSSQSIDQPMSDPAEANQGSTEDTVKSDGNEISQEKSSSNNICENEKTESECSGLKQNSKQIDSLVQSKISETVKAEHDYIKEMPAEMIDKSTLTKQRSRKSSGHQLCDDEISHKKIKSEMALHVDRENDITNCNNSSSTETENTKTKSQNKASKSKNYGCRCGLATPKPGNLTCCGQRCPCYSAFKGCEGCKCRGCRNPRGDPAKNPMAALRLQRQLQAVQIIPAPLGHTNDIESIEITHTLLPVPGLGDEDLDIEIDI